MDLFHLLKMMQKCENTCSVQQALGLLHTMHLIRCFRVFTFFTVLTLFENPHILFPIRDTYYKMM